LEAERAQFVGDPLLSLEGARGAGPAVGETVGELLRDGERLRAAEGRRETWPLERRRVGDREGGDQERQRDDEPGAAVEPRIDRPLE
jgi:hypothetical protein